MTNLSDNLKKYLVERVISLILLIIFIVVFLYASLLAFTYGTAQGIIVSVALVVVFYLADKLIRKGVEKIKVKKMTLEEKKRFNVFDFVYTLIIGMGLMVFLSLYFKMSALVLFIFLAVVILIKEFGKRKELKEYGD